MMGPLTGKVAIVTGGGQGVGLGIAAAFARAGASLILSGRDVAKLEQSAASLELIGGTVSVIAADVAVRADADKTIAATVERLGRIDILVNNAQSAAYGTPLVTLDDDQIALTLGSGLMGTIYHMQAAYPHLKVRGGSVINMGSREGLQGGKGFGIYAATKEAIRGWSRVAAREWGTDKIRVNTLCPGALSPASAEFLDANAELKNAYLAEIALGHFGDAEQDVGGVAVFLACDDSRFVTGQTLCADGGMAML
jgi:NAD(P)-dependent dehydrogenase (short-subunit alcohol dehydrogenase family)